MEVDEDSISKLPNEILTHILSHICTRHAMATSVLSKRWKLVWTLVPNLLFDSPYRCKSRTVEEQQANFENFVDRVLSLNNVLSVRNVKLFCYRTDALRVKAWVRALAMRSVEKFGLGVSLPCLNMFPDVFFNQKKLVKLTLSNVALKVPPSVCFPCLETVRLNCVTLMDDESITNLLSGCPALTDLLLHPADLLLKRTFCIRSSTLQYTPDGVNIVLKLEASCYSYKCPWNNPLDLPQSISSCIKSVEITKQNGLSVVSCILKNATTSKRLSFRGFPTHVVQENEVIKTFLAAAWQETHQHSSFSSTGVR